MAIEYNITEKEIARLSEYGVTINRVPIEEVFVYLTENKEGGEYHVNQSDK